MDKPCQDCKVMMFDVQHNTLYCDDCRKIRTKNNIKRAAIKTKEEMLVTKATNKVRGKKKPLNNKWLVRGL